MLLKKIKIKQYFLISLVISGVLLYLNPELTTLMAQGLSILNHISIVIIVNEALKTSVRKKRIMAFVGLKLVTIGLIGLFLFFAGAKEMTVFSIVYLLQLVVLGLCLKS